MRINHATQADSIGLLGSFRYSQAFGEEVDDITETDAVHLIASATKLVTTVAVMQCVEKGLLDLDADVSKILPEWENPQILTGFDENDVPFLRPSEKAITLRQVIRPNAMASQKYLP